MFGFFRRPPASARLPTALDAYERSIRVWADRQTDGTARTRAAERLDAIHAMRAAVADGELGRAATFVNDEERDRVARLLRAGR